MGFVLSEVLEKAGFENVSGSLESVSSPSHNEANISHLETFVENICRTCKDHDSVVVREELLGVLDNACRKGICIQTSCQVIYESLLDDSHRVVVCAAKAAISAMQALFSVCRTQDASERTMRLWVLANKLKREGLKCAMSQVGPICVAGLRFVQQLCFLFTSPSRISCGTECKGGVLLITGHEFLDPCLLAEQAHLGVMLIANQVQRLSQEGEVMKNGGSKSLSLQVAIQSLAFIIRERQHFVEVALPPLLKLHAVLPKPKNCDSGGRSVQHTLKQCLLSVSFVLDTDVETSLRGGLVEALAELGVSQFREEAQRMKTELAKEHELWREREKEWEKEKMREEDEVPVDGKNQPSPDGVPRKREAEAAAEEGEPAAKKAKVEPETPAPKVEDDAAEKPKEEAKSAAAGGGVTPATVSGVTLCSGASPHAGLTYEDLIELQKLAHSREQITMTTAEHGLLDLVIQGLSALPAPASAEKLLVRFVEYLRLEIDAHSAEVEAAAAAAAAAAASAEASLQEGGRLGYGDAGDEDDAMDLSPLGADEDVVMETSEAPSAPPPIVAPPQPPAKTLPPLRMPRLLSAECRKIEESAAVRIVAAERKAAVAGVLEARANLLARLALVQDDDSEFHDRLLRHIMRSLETRHDLLVLWLTLEYLYRPARYGALLKRCLESLRERTDSRDPVFTRLLLAVPLVTRDAIDVLRSYCEGTETMNRGFLTLRDLIAQRPAARDTCLNVLLSYTASKKNGIRTHAIRLVANKLFMDVELKKKIIDYAKGMMHRVQVATRAETEEEATEMRKAARKEHGDGDGSDKDDLSEGEEGEVDDADETVVVMTDDDVRRNILFYMALCSKQHDLIDGLIEVYVEAHHSIKPVILRFVRNLSKTIPTSSSYLLRTIAHFPKGAELFVLRMLFALTEDEPPTPSLVGAVRLYHNKAHDTRFMVPIIGALPRDEISSLIPSLVSLPNDIFKAAVARMFPKAKQGVTPHPYACPPASFLIAIHNLRFNEPDALPVKKAIEAIQICLSHRSVFTFTEIAVALQQLIEAEPIPILFMRTMLEVLRAHKSKANALVSFLDRLATKKVWNNKNLWQGFLKCCGEIGPASVAVFLRLPQAQLQEALEAAPHLIDPLRNHARSHRASMPKATLSLIGLDRR